MPSQNKALLPKAEDLARLGPKEVELVMDAISREGDRDLQYASLAMRCGTCCLLGCLAAVCYLATIHEQTLARLVLGTEVTAVLTAIIGQRLRKDRRTAQKDQTPGQ